LRGQKNNKKHLSKQQVAFYKKHGTVIDILCASLVYIQEIFLLTSHMEVAQMKKKISKISLALIGTLLLAAPVLGADFSTMTNEELSALRGTMRNAPPEEHAAFQQEWQERLQQMTPAERQQYAGKPADAPQDGTGMQLGNPSGSGKGSGSGMGGRRGGGNGGGR
jgi:hypothetical protein